MLDISDHQMEIKNRLLEERNEQIQEHESTIGSLMEKEASLRRQVATLLQSTVPRSFTTDAGLGSSQALVEGGAMF